MKTLFTAIILLAAITCRAQSIDMFDQPKKYQTDTVRVFLMVMDTSMSAVAYEYEDRYEKAGEVAWITAFAVRKNLVRKIDGQDIMIAETEKYIDLQGKPLPKSIIVWMARELK